MRAERLADGRIRIPTSEETAGGDLAHGFDDIGPDDPRYAAYDRWLKQEDSARG